MRTIIQQLTLSLIITCLLSLVTSSVYAKKSPWVGTSFSNAQCKGKGQGYGPFDYTQRASLWQELRKVEDYHFTPPVRSLIRGQSTKLVGDIDYTLIAWPNHHHALDAISRYQIIHTSSSNKLYRPKTRSPVECYFQRAINFSPEDATTRMLYGIYLHKIKRFKMATKEYEKAVKLSPNNPVIRYNYGLLLVNLKKYDLAQEQAIIAYDAGFPLNGLKNKLKAANHWLPKAKPVAPDSEEKEKTN